MSKERVKILFVIDTLYNAGAEKSLFEITRNFKEVIPVFVHIYEENTLKNDFLKNGIKVYSLDVPGPWNFKLAEQKLKEIYIQEKPDAIHATLFRSEILTRRLKKKFPDIPLINSFVSDSYSKQKLKNHPLSRKLKGKLIQKWDSWTAGNVNYFISNSETVKVSMCKSIKVPEEKVRVIYRGRDLKSLLPTGNFKIKELIDRHDLQRKTVLSNVGRLIDSKGQKDIIEIMPDLLQKHPEVILLIAGEGNMRRQLEDLIEEKDLTSQVVLLGNRSDIPDLLDLSDIFVFPTYLEGLPGALIEAMMSKPVICCSNIPVNLECVDESSAVIFEVGNKDDLFKKLSFTISNLPSLQQRSEKALEIASKNFEIKQISSYYEQFYKDITASNLKKEES